MLYVEQEERSSSGAGHRERGREDGLAAVVINGGGCEHQAIGHPPSSTVSMTRSRGFVPSLSSNRIRVHRDRGEHLGDPINPSRVIQVLRNSDFQIWYLKFV